MSYPLRPCHARCLRPVLGVAGRARAAGGTVSSTSPWHGLSPQPPDPILGLVADFKRDSHSSKVNVAQGAYRTDEGKPLVLESVKRAERRLTDALLSGSSDKEYLPIEGSEVFCRLSAELVLGKGSAGLSEGRVATLQTISGTGALRVASQALHDIAGKRDVWVSDPSWGNHAHVFRTAGFRVHRHAYLSGATGTTLDFGAMLRDLEEVPTGGVVLLHACAHNPTGIDPSPRQWEALAGLFVRRGLVALFDSAYQGYASGDLHADAASVRLFERAGALPVVCQSYAKSLGLYGERIGAVNFVCRSREEAAAVASNVKQRIIRPMYSSPPLHGARLAACVLGDAELFGLWQSELEVMSSRVRAMREGLAAELRRAGAPDASGGDWAHITDQIGMFAFTGLKECHVDRLREQYHIYLTRDGRMSMAGLRAADIEYVARAISAVLTQE